MDIAELIIADLKAKSCSKKAELLSSFFQTKEGQYSHGDIFLGVTVPEIRKSVLPYKDIPLDEVSKLLISKYHESRFAALVILVNQFQKAEESKKKNIYEFYLSNTKWINSWDLVDVSCRKIVGEWLLDKDRSVLYDLAKDSWLWNQRIAIVSTYAFIRKNDFKDTLQLSEYFLDHSHHLIHKACGWMLREVGKKEIEVLLNFLEKFAAKMPRVMLRYAIERLSIEERRYFLSIK